VTDPFGGGYYDTSYPPEILRGYEPPALVGAARTAATAEHTLTVAAGEPGTYEPELAGRERPRNVSELRARARVIDPAPWPAGTYVLVGVNGKRAHWTGEDWKLGDSPGYKLGTPPDADSDKPLVVEQLADGRLGLAGEGAEAP